MAKLSVVPFKNPTTGQINYRVIESATGQQIYQTTDFFIARDFARSGRTDAGIIALANERTINSQGGIQSTAPSVTNPPDPQIPPNISDTVPPRDLVTSVSGTTVFEGTSTITVESDDITAQPRPVTNPPNPQTGEFVRDPATGQFFPANSTQGRQVIVENTTVRNSTAAAVGGEFSEVYNPTTGKWDVFNLETGNVVSTGLTQQQATIEAQNRSVGDPAYGEVNPATGTPAGVAQSQVYIDQAAAEQATLNQARAQAAINAQNKQVNQGDWRVKLRLAPSANYLYNSANPGILAPLSNASGTGGVIFPYTPTINMAYHANYNTSDLTHSNYRGVFYQSSYVGEIQMQATFTAQDTAEADYLLAVIHFFRSVTKMFYGQDAQRGAPPPLVFLSGLGQFQFNNHPCVVKDFNYNLPADVDYIRARSTNINGTSLQQKRTRQSLPTNPFSAAWERLQNALPGGLPKGGQPIPPAPPTLGTNSPTYVPTKIDISIVLIPIQSREQVSRQFSLDKFSNGDLLKGGFW